MKLNLLFCAGIIGAAMLFPVVAAAQEDQCLLPTAVVPQAAVDNVVAACCSRARSGLKKRCVSRSVRKVKKTSRSFGSTVTRPLVRELNQLKDPVCGDTTALACTNSNTATIEEVVANIESSCCDKRFMLERKSCLERQRRFIRNARSIYSGAFYRTIRASVETFLAAPSCGRGGKKSRCNTTRKNSDGSGNWLHKPVSDSTGSIVNLLPSRDDASSCRYETRTGKKIRDAISTGRTNGFRETWRPAGGGSCGSFPDNMVFSCQIGRSRVCYNIPDACNRYD